MDEPPFMIFGRRNRYGRAIRKLAAFISAHRRIVTSAITSLATEKRLNRNSKHPCQGESFIIEDVTLSFFNSRDCRSIHIHAQSGEPTREVVLAYENPLGKP